MSEYEFKVERLCKLYEGLRGTAGGRALRAVVMDLEGNGPIGEMLHSLDRNNFDLVIDTLIEFRDTGRYESFNAIHSAARQRINKKAPPK